MITQLERATVAVCLVLAFGLFALAMAFHAGYDDYWWAGPAMNVPCWIIGFITIRRIWLLPWLAKRQAKAASQR